MQELRTLQQDVKELREENKVLKTELFVAVRGNIYSILRVELIFHEISWIAGAYFYNSMGKNQHMNTNINYKNTLIQYF